MKRKPEEIEVQNLTTDQPQAPLQEELAVERDLNLRLRAEFENFRKRARHDQTEAGARGVRDFVLELLPILDNFERAADAAERSHNYDALAGGVQLILRQMADLLMKHHIEPIPAKGQPFDPERHEAMQTVVNEELPEHTVLDETERGYTMKGRVIRPSRVTVTTRPTHGE